MALFPLPLPASSPSPPPPSAGCWSLISAGKGQKEGEALREGGRGNKGRKVGRITHEDEKAGGRTDGEDVDEVGERSGGQTSPSASGLATDLSREQEAFGIVVL